MPLPIVPAPTTPMISDTSQALRFCLLTAPVGRLRRRDVVAWSRLLLRALRLPVEAARVPERRAPVLRRLVAARARAVHVLALPEEEPERVDAQRRPEREAQRAQHGRDDAHHLRPALALEHR